MVDFKRLLAKKKTCIICGKIHEKILREIDGLCICPNCFSMLLREGWLSEGEDDYWHFENTDDLELL